MKTLTTSYSDSPELISGCNRNVEGFLALFKNHDHYYEYSDDIAVWRAGEKNYSYLMSKCRDYGLTKAEAIELYQERYLKADV